MGLSRAAADGVACGAELKSTWVRICHTEEGTGKRGRSVFASKLSNAEAASSSRSLFAPTPRGAARTDVFLSALPRLASASSPSRFCQPRAPLADMGRTAEEPASASADTLAAGSRVLRRSRSPCGRARRSCGCSCKAAPRCLRGEFRHHLLPSTLVTRRRSGGITCSLLIVPLFVLHTKVLAQNSHKFGSQRTLRALDAHPQPDQLRDMRSIPPRSGGLRCGPFGPEDPILRAKSRRA